MRVEHPSIVDFPVLDKWTLSIDDALEVNDASVESVPVPGHAIVLASWYVPNVINRVSHYAPE